MLTVVEVVFVDEVLEIAVFVDEVLEAAVFVDEVLEVFATVYLTAGVGLLGTCLGIPISTFLVYNTAFGLTGFTSIFALVISLLSSLLSSFCSMP